jgi:anti-sigma factor RsiW
MTDDPHENPIRELTWRRKLTPSEEAQLSQWLETHPEAQSEQESDMALNEALDLLPDAPLSSNFTARVLRAATAEPALSPPRASVWAAIFKSLRWLPRMALVALTLGLALISYEHFREAHRVRMARDAAVLSEVISLPGPKGLEDFEVIRAINRTPAADEELLKLLQ